MKATMTDPVFGPLVWDEDAESYRGSVDFPPGNAVALALVIHNPDECSQREFAAFIAAARTHFQQVRRDDSRYRRRAAEVAEKALQKQGTAPAGAPPLADRLRVHTVQIDNAGITMLYYDAGGVLPPKQRFVAVGLDMTGEIHLARAVRQPE